MGPPAQPNRTLTALRRRLGMTQEQYATAVGASSREVRAWESGQVRCPQAWSLARLHSLHGTTAPEDLGFKPRQQSRTGDTVRATDHAEAIVFRRDLLGLVAAAAFSARPVPALVGLLNSTEPAGAVGAVDVERVQRTNTALYGADLLVGGAAVEPAGLIDQYRKAATGLRGTFQREATRQAMHSAVAHLGSTIGFMLFDQGHHVRARQVYTASLRVAADATDCWPLRAIICSELARQCQHLGAFKEADELIRIAHGADAEVTPTFRAMLHAQSATTAAHSGDVPATRRYFRMAEDAFADAEPAEDPDWISWFDTAELNGETGNALALLAIDHEQVRDEAAGRLTEAASSHGPTEQRSTALALTRLAGIHAARHDANETARTTRLALDITERLRSPRVTDELAALRPRLRPLQGNREVAEVDRAITGLTAAAP